MPLPRLAAAALCSALALGTAARADWEGDLVMKRGDRAMPTGKVRFKAGKLRTEMAMGPMKMTTLVDFAKRKVLMLNDEAKTYSEMDADKSGHANFAKCSGGDFKACMKQQGFKEVGKEEVNGQASTVWEGDHKTKSGTVHQKIWHPDAAGKDFAFVRTESRGARGDEGVVEVENFTVADQDDAQFQVPEGYTKGEGMFPGMKMGPPSMKGFHPKPGGPTGGEVKEKDE